MAIRRILITAGGTGGHLYPAQALAQQCMKHQERAEVLFVAGGLSSNRYFDRDCFAFEEIASSPLLSRHPLKSLKGFSHLCKGFWQSQAILKKYQPNVVVGFGSYYTVPVLLAARWLNIPIVLHEANSIPGRANRWLSSLATCIALHFPSTASFFKGNTVEVGLPLREGYSLATVDKEKALAYYGFSSQLQTMLICGGSQGARAINLLIQDCLPVFKKLSLQVIHLTGDAESANVLTSLYAHHQIPAQVKQFETSMQMAWRVADGFIGRSGASTIAEAIEFEVPGILIPYPHATDQHQDKNADFLVENVKSAWKLSEKRLTSSLLGEKLVSLFQGEQFLAFKHALKDYKQRPHQMTLCQLIFSL